MAKNIPVYLFIGFLEGGKTHIIQESMQDERFNTGEKTLIIQCEEGIDELDLTSFNSRNCYLKNIEDESEINRDNLNAIAKEHKIDRIIIEYNGMWLTQKLFEEMPENWSVYQCMMFADANTFITYNANMRQLMFDKLSAAEMVVLTRTPDNIDKAEVHKIARSASKRINIAYDYPDGHIEYDEIEDPLPFDIDKPVIEIADDDYAIWYRDLSEEMKKYKGKKVSFKGIVAREGKLPKSQLALGRHVMTCCEADIAYTALICVFDRDVDYKTRDWITVTAEVALEKHPMYGGRTGPVLHVISDAPTDRPENEVATFYR